jgi:hypothetical protein
MLDNERKRLVNAIMIFANLLVLSNSLAIHSLTDPEYGR